MSCYGSIERPIVWECYAERCPSVCRCQELKVERVIGGITNEV